MKNLWLVIAFAFCIGTSVLAGDTKEKEVNELLELVGAKRQLQELPAVIVNEFKNQLAQYTSANIEEDLAVLEDILDPREAYRGVVNRVLAAYDGNKVAELLDTFNTPLFKSFTEMEVRTSTPGALEGMRIYAQGLQDDPPMLYRVELVNRLDNAVGATTLNMKIMEVVMKGVVYALNGLEENREKMSEPELRDFLAKLSEGVTSTMKGSTIVSFLYTYRDASTCDLLKLVQFYESDTGSWLASLSSDAVMAELEQPLNMFSHRMIDVFEKLDRAGLLIDDTNAVPAVSK